MKKLNGLMKKAGLVLLVIVLSFLLGPNHFVQAGLEGKVLIFHAGSLTIPFARLEEAFEARYPEVDVIREAAGSRTSARKVTELGRKADLVASADYTVIKNLMMPDFTDWYLNFATNEMAIMYTPHSRYHDQINLNNWYQILLRPDVEYGHSNPDADPCGYRTMLVWKLAEKYYQEPELYQKLDQGRSVRNIRPKETDLIALLEAGELDYIFIYRSVASQHNLPYVVLPDEINLKTDKFANFYATASFDISGKEPGAYITQRGKPMVYGITMPDNAPNREGAVAFIKFLLSEEGQQIMADNGQPPITPALTNNFNAIPKELRNLVESE